LRPTWAKKLARFYFKEQARHSSNPSLIGGRGRRIVVGGQPWAKSRRTYLKNKLKAKKVEGIAQVVQYFKTQHHQK
jgi:hypothetical protein